MKKIALLSGLALLIPKAALAHCPLCTVGAGALAVLAASLGVSSVAVGIFIGAFALALGLWLAPLIKKQYMPYQRHVLSFVIFLATVLPIMPLIRDYGPFYISLAGDYGSPLHNTYTINLFVLGVVVGALIVAFAPFLSRSLTKARHKQFPYQGMIITLALLTVASVTAQLLS